jgi:hypothetical protein
MILFHYMNLLLKFVFFVLAAFLFASCTKTASGLAGANGQTGSAGANGSYTGSAITGYVNLYDQYGVADSSNGSVGVFTQSGDSIVSSLTDSTGKFVLPNLVLGSYDLHFTKNGFDSLKVYVVHSGGNEDKFIGDIRMDQSLTTQITDETFSFVSTGIPNDTNLAMQVYISFDGPAQTQFTRRDFGMYFSRSAQVNSQNYDVVATTLFSSANTNSPNQIPMEVFLENFIAQGFHPSKGDSVYFKTYVLPVSGTATTWFNFSTNQTVSYPYLGDSTFNFFIWPQ